MRKLIIKYCLFQDHGHGNYRFSPEMTAEFYGSPGDNAVAFVQSCYPPKEFSLRSISTARESGK